jgi:hypothetical protein
LQETKKNVTYGKMQTMEKPALLNVDNALADTQQTSAPLPELRKIAATALTLITHLTYLALHSSRKHKNITREIPITCYHISLQTNHTHKTYSQPTPLITQPSRNTHPLKKTPP